MCGIASYSGKTNFNKDKMKLLLTYNSILRGDDALGYYSPLNGLYKKAGKPVDLLPKVDLKEDVYFIGHVRAASSGGKTDKQAHPFQFDELVGVMNGTVSNCWQLVNKYGLNVTDYDVDSEAIFAIIQKEQSFKVLGELNGGCAIITADTRNPDVMYVFRNLERPLYRGNLDGGMYISSIEESLKIIGCERVVEFKPNIIYTIIGGEISHNAPIKIDVYNDKANTDLSGKVEIRLNDTNNSSYLNRWVLFDSPHYTPNSHLVSEFTKNKWYFCYNYVKGSETEICVRNNKNKAIVLEKRAFTYSSAFPRSGDYMLLLHDLYFGSKKKKQLIGKKNEVVKLVQYFRTHKVEFCTLGAPVETWIIGSKAIRPLSSSEKFTFECSLRSDPTCKILKVEKETVKPEREIDYTLVDHEDIHSDILDVNRNRTPIIPPWTRAHDGDGFINQGTGLCGVANRQLQIPGTEIIPIDNIEDEDVVITHKEFKNLLNQVRYATNNITIDMYTQTLPPWVKKSIEENLQEIDRYLDRAQEKYTNSQS